MKKKSKSIARVIYLISRVLALIYFIVLGYSLFCLITGRQIKISDNGQIVSVLYPFSETPFFNLENHKPYLILGFVLPLLLYAFYFLAASNVFKVFTLDRLFTKKNLKYLQLFYLINLFLPFPVAILCSIFIEIPNGLWMLSLVHFNLGVFIYFLAEIFAQGIGLQDEQELFI
ncbi:DUF2975 domain-containing protein [Sinomicrobium oceani]|uniref:DUF2975 domain-containing protein n=1 Tax=Sinomicrobium oceani TaxID=1150368 RepID=UPI00227BB911|nr:DUF2975 domain-containing protein [Sinomicrobium oceani]